MMGRSRDGSSPSAGWPSPSGRLDDIRAKADALQMALPAVNRAVLRALVAARQLD
jgi:hypothetical protein